MAVTAISVGAGSLTIGAASDLMAFSSQTTECVLEPEIDQGDNIQVLSGEYVSGERTESWKLSGSFLTDLGAVDSIWEKLFELRGTVQVFEFVPNTTAGKKLSGSLVVEATAIGGTVGEHSQSEFEFSLVGAPVLGEIV